MREGILKMGAFLTLMVAALCFSASALAGNIDANYSRAWNEKSGWVDFRPPDGGVTVEATYLEGYAWSDSIGWVDLGGGSGPYGNSSISDFGVNNDGTGNLSGYGWSEKFGWLNFASGDYPERVVIDSEGNFSGYAWNKNVGWTNFSSTGPVDYKVKTEWMPPPIPTPTVIPTPSLIPTPSIAPTPSLTPTPSATPTAVPTASPTPSVTPSVTPTPSLPPSPSPSLTPPPSPTPLPGEGNIDWTYRWAWNEKSGWVDFRPPDGGVTVEATYLEGYAWSDSIGWVDLGGGSGPYGNSSISDFGVNNDGTGNLSGYGWSEKFGWLNFASGDYPQRVVIDSEGNFSGYAWNKNVGWTNFSSSGPVDYKVKTDWFPTTPTPSPTATPTATATATPTVVPTVTPSITPVPTVTPVPTPEGGYGLELTLFLHGYLNTTTFVDGDNFTQQTATMVGEFRTSRNQAAANQYYFFLDEQGRSGMTGLPGLVGGDYYLLLKQRLYGGTFSSQTEELPLGSHHFPVISKQKITLGEGGITAVNFSDQCSSNFVEAFASSAAGAFSPMIELGTSGRYWMLGGGDANGDCIINITDIAIWDTQITYPDSSERGGARFTEQGNFDGDDRINLFDFNVWAKMRALGVTWAPYTE